MRHVTSLSAHILPTSATMIGVCMTVLTIGHIGPAGEIRWIIDKLLALDAPLVTRLLVPLRIGVRKRSVRTPGRAHQAACRLSVSTGGGIFGGSGSEPHVAH